VERLIQAISRQDPTGGKGKALDAEPYRKQFIEAMDDDFNTAQALATLFDLAKAINEAGDAGISFANAQSILVSLAREVLGLKLPRIINVEVTDGISMRATVDATVIPGKLVPPEHVPDNVKALVNHLVEERVKCRKEEEWQRADEIRSKLAELGITLEDTKERTYTTYKGVPSEESLDSLMGELGIAL